ncbi:7alpha-cephem-methoxylase P8 chain [Fusarium subglutinans]|uniref:7alpha-cephem-methoxylase P8 chain n=1 Tax=Gibberella subglutinans TaxID=42677 RepID=A0A8H5LE76_GIBSU|nr:7alpha-cephem-methoxylase P8 chain [Fusarium subglutinans]KAF5589036.1 7alpha-cephem-methoxylase P8 chain [Fusarium subglutinans]
MSCTTKIPRGDVIVPLNFYEAPANGSEPYFVVSREDGIAPKFNFSDNSVDVIISDIRDSENTFSLDRDAFQIVTDASPPSEGIDFTDDESIRVNYYPEVQQLISERLPGDLQIFIYDHTVRHQVEGGAQHRPLTRVHIDHTTNNAIQRVRQFFPTEADRLLKGRYRIVNVWRPLNKKPLESYPLAFASASTFDNADVVPIQHRYMDGSLVREAGLIKHRSSQAWYYLSGMTDRERILLKCFDSDSLEGGSGTACKTPHTAFRDPRTQENAEGRFSIEVRGMVFGG